MKVLTERQVRDYRQNGFLFPIPALTPGEAAEALANLGRFEARIGSPLPQAEKRYRQGTHTFLPWVDALIRHPRVLDAVEAVIGPDILAFWATFFIKEPGSPIYSAWHQDSTYFGLDPHEHFTAWIALSDASRDAGCMDVLPPNGVPRQYHHGKGLKDSLNGSGQHIIEPLDESGITSMELTAGQMSFHNTLCPHRSMPNRSTYRRVGFGVSYIPAHVRTTGSYRLPAVLVRGSDKGNFDLLPSPRGEFDPEAIATGDKVYARFFEHYAEQQARHERQFAHLAASDKNGRQA